jgi:Protein of Unknown function (DUF2784)
MGFDALADAVVVLHLAFILFVAVGALLACRWPWLTWLHVPALAWGVGIIAIGWDCPLTPLEQWLRRQDGESYEGGFVDRYLEDVVYPAELTPLLRAVAVALVVLGYVRLRSLSRRRRGGAPTPSAMPGPSRRGPSA